MAADLFEDHLRGCTNSGFCWNLFCRYPIPLWPSTERHSEGRRKNGSYGVRVFPQRVQSALAGTGCHRTYPFVGVLLFISRLCLSDRKRFLVYRRHHDLSQQIFSTVHAPVTDTSAASFGSLHATWRYKTLTAIAFGGGIEWPDCDMKRASRIETSFQEVNESETGREQRRMI